VSPTVFWQFLYRRPVPIDRFKILIEALRMTKGEADAFREAYIIDANERRHPRRRPPRSPTITSSPPAHATLRAENDDTEAKAHTSGSILMAFTDTGSRALRASWRDFPLEYIEALRQADTEEVRLGPMTWNDARFAQREFYRLIAVLRRAPVDDPTAVLLDDIARRLRVSCPRCEDGDLTLHWLVLKKNPIIAAMRSLNHSTR
jgi:hypothetical protein